MIAINDVAIETIDVQVNASIDTFLQVSSVTFVTRQHFQGSNRVILKLNQADQKIWHYYLVAGMTKLHS